MKTTITNTQFKLDFSKLESKSPNKKYVNNTSKRSKEKSKISTNMSSFRFKESDFTATPLEFNDGNSSTRLRKTYKIDSGNTLSNFNNINTYSSINFIDSLEDGNTTKRTNKSNNSNSKPNNKKSREEEILSKYHNQTQTQKNSGSSSLRKIAIAKRVSAYNNIKVGDARINFNKDKNSVLNTYLSNLYSNQSEDLLLRLENIFNYKRKTDSNNEISDNDYFDYVLYNRPGKHVHFPPGFSTCSSDPNNKDIKVKSMSCCEYDISENSGQESVNCKIKENKDEVKIKPATDTNAKLLNNLSQECKKKESLRSKESSDVNILDNANTPPLQMRRSGEEKGKQIKNEKQEETSRVENSLKKEKDRNSFHIMHKEESVIGIVTPKYKDYTFKKNEEESSFKQMNTEKRKIPGLIDSELEIYQDSKEQIDSNNKQQKQQKLNPKTDSKDTVIEKEGSKNLEILYKPKNASFETDYNAFFQPPKVSKRKLSYSKEDNFQSRMEKLQNNSLLEYKIERVFNYFDDFWFFVTPKSKEHATSLDGFTFNDDNLWINAKSLGYTQEEIISSSYFKSFKSLHTLDLQKEVDKTNNQVKSLQQSYLKFLNNISYVLEENLKNFKEKKLSLPGMEIISLSISEYIEKLKECLESQKQSCDVENILQKSSEDIQEKFRHASTICFNLDNKEGGQHAFQSRKSAQNIYYEEEVVVNVTELNDRLRRLEGENLDLYAKISTMKDIPIVNASFVKPIEQQSENEQLSKSPKQDTSMLLGSDQSLQKVIRNQSTEIFYLKQILEISEELQKGYNTSKKELKERFLKKEQAYRAEIEMLRKKQEKYEGREGNDNKSNVLESLKNAFKVETPAEQEDVFRSELISEDEDEDEGFETVVKDEN